MDIHEGLEFKIEWFVDADMRGHRQFLKYFGVTPSVEELEAMEAVRSYFAREEAA